MILIYDLSNCKSILEEELNTQRRENIVVLNWWSQILSKCAIVRKGHEIDN